MSKRRNDRKDDRRRDAIERQAVADGLSNAERLATLDTKLGVGEGATKERARLEKENDNG